jgi:hypothetical protein
MGPRVTVRREGDRPRCRLRRLVSATSGLVQIMLMAAFLILHPSFHIPVHAVSNAGSTGASFLEIGVGARAGAMGEAYTAWADDVYGLYFNPAGVARVRRQEVGFLHNTLFADLNYSYMGYIYPTRGDGVWGVSATYVDLGDVDRTTLASGQANQIIGRASGSDLAFSVTYARAITRTLDLGASVKVIHEKLDRFDATAGAVDLGLRWHQPLQGLTIGLSVANLGSKLQFVRESEELPITLRLGGAYRSPSRYWGISSDVVWVKDQDVEAKIGGEVWVWPEHLALRMGANSSNDISNTGFTAGAGFLWDDLAVDYAYVPQDDVEDKHLMSLTYQFGPLRPARDWEERAPKPRTLVAEGRRGLYAAPFRYRAGIERYDWFGMATMEIFRSDWRDLGIAVSPETALYRIEGDYWIASGRVTLSARLYSGNEVIRNFEAEGDVERPFPVWDDLLVQVNSELARLGVDVITVSLPVYR